MHRSRAERPSVSKVEVKRSANIIGHHIARMQLYSKQINQKMSEKKLVHFSTCACHPCGGAMLIFSVSYQFYRMIPEENPVSWYTRRVKPPPIPNYNLDDANSRQSHGAWTQWNLNAPHILGFTGTALSLVQPVWPLSWIWTAPSLNAHDLELWNSIFLCQFFAKNRAHRKQTPLQPCSRWTRDDAMTHMNIFCRLRPDQYAHLTP